ncbi:NADPH-dependent F420 reductase [Streptomyces sp. NPDC015127]|uniref:NADPH-dependent F420 reductase n=1 Tax=Streptomyces sp. NPDC015127 TaxID=3364939 RepID=UPI0036F969FB
MTNIAIIGTGNVARTLAAGVARAGHDVVLGSRDPQNRKDLDHPVVTVAEAAAHGDIVVNATPGNAESIALLAAVRQHLAGKVLLDVTVALTPAMDLVHHGTSVGELLQQELPDTKVVKSLCTMDVSVMVRPGLLTSPGTVFLSGDDAGAKKRVGELLEDFGWPAASRLDLGGIATARGQEHFALLFVGVATALGAHVFNVEVVRAR